MLDERTILFRRGLEVWPLNVEFSCEPPDPDSGLPRGERCIYRVQFWNSNRRCWQRFALTDQEFWALDERINDSD